MSDETRQALEKNAKAHGRSLNSEIVQRLEQSLHNDLGEQLFAPPLLDAIADRLRGVLEEYGADHVFPKKTARG